MSHLTFFRKISAVDLDGLMRATGVLAQMVSGYQYNLNRKLVPVEAGHQAGSFANPQVRFTGNVRLAATP